MTVLESVGIVAGEMGNLAERIKQVRKTAKLSQEKFAETLGEVDGVRITRGAVGNWELGGGISRGNLSAISEKFDVALDWLERGKGEPPSDKQAPQIIRPSGPEVSEVLKVGEGWPDTGEEWMDVRGVTVGGDDSFFYFGDVIDQVRRPPGIRNAKNVAALNVAGESMVPRFAPGELIYVQHRAPAPGDDVVVELYPENEGDPPKSFLKRLVRKTGPRLYCRQFNPASDLEFDNGEVKILWRVLTLRDLLG